MSGPAKVAQFNMHRIQIGNQNILGLNVSVDYVPVLKVEQSFDHLSYDVTGAVLAEALLAPQLLVQVAVFAVFEHHVDVLGVVEVPVQTDNIRMVQSPLNFKLAFHLAEEIKLLEHVLENDFESAWDASRPLNGLEDLAELATADRLDAREVVHGPTVFPLCLLGRLGRAPRSLLLKIVGLLIRTASCDFCHILYSL